MASKEIKATGRDFEKMLQTFPADPTGLMERQRETITMELAKCYSAIVARRKANADRQGVEFFLDRQSVDIELNRMVITIAVPVA